MIIICKEGTSDLFHTAAATSMEETEYSVNYTKIIKMINEQNPYCEQFIDLDDSYGYLLYAFLKKNNIHYNFSGEFSNREIVDITLQWDAQELAEKEVPVGVKSEFKA